MKYFVADTATVIGDVTVGEGSNFWYGAVARGDISYITIGKNTNVQDNATLHVDYDVPLSIGDYVTVGHNAIVHGCQVGNNCLIGIGAIVLSRSVIGDNCIIGAGALITEGTVIPPNSLVVGIPGKVVRQVSEEEIKSIRKSAMAYVKQWQENPLYR